MADSVLNAVCVAGPCDGQIFTPGAASGALISVEDNDHRVWKYQLTETILTHQKYGFVRVAEYADETL